MSKLAYRRSEVTMISSEGTTPHRMDSKVPVRINGSVEAEENLSKVGFRPFAGVRLKLQLDVDYEGGADSEQQISLRM